MLVSSRIGVVLWVLPASRRRTSSGPSQGMGSPFLPDDYVADERRQLHFPSGDNYTSPSVIPVVGSYCRAAVGAVAFSTPVTRSSTTARAIASAMSSTAIHGTKARPLPSGPPSPALNYRWPRCP